MIKTTLTQFSMQHVSAVKGSPLKIAITRKEIEVYKIDQDFVEFNRNHKPITMNKVIQDPTRKDRVVIWCEQYEMDEDIALGEIKVWYKGQLQSDIERCEELVTKSKEKLANCDDMFIIRKGG